MSRVVAALVLVLCVHANAFAWGDTRDNDRYRDDTRGYSLSEFKAMQGIKSEPVVKQPSWLDRLGSSIASKAQWWHNRNAEISVVHRDQPIRFIYGNGIGNPSPEGRAPDYAAMFSADMAGRGFSRDSVVVLSLYEKGNLLSGPADWVWNEMTGTLSAEVGQKLDAAFAGRPKEQWNTPVTALTYSGNFAPFLDAVNARPHLPISTIVSVGPAWTKADGIDRVMQNQNIKLIVNVYGADDFVVKLANFTDGNMRNAKVNVINVKLLGVGHTDYFFDHKKPEVQTNARVLTVTLAEKAAQGGRFISEYLRQLTENTKATYDSSRQLYTVDVGRLSQSELRGR